MDALALLTAAYRPLLGFAAELDDDGGWVPTALPGWCVRDLLFHLLTDAQRALVALAVPVDQPVDTDAVTYWDRWQPGSDVAEQNLRSVRVQASAWTHVADLAVVYVETARAVLAAGRRAGAEDVVATQGHVLTAADLLCTLAVEATVHHLDLGAALAMPPDEDCLDEVRRVLDGLLGSPAPAEWDTVRYIAIGTGRASPTDDEAAGISTGSLPLFG